MSKIKQQDEQLAKAIRHVEKVDQDLREVAARATPHTAIVIGAWLCEAITSVEACHAIGIPLTTGKTPDGLENHATDRMNAFCSRLPEENRGMLAAAALNPEQSSPST